MASIINANTSGGLISTGDTSGQLQLQTGGTTALTVTSAQLVGLGTTSPATVLDVATSNSGITLTNTAVSNKQWRLGGNSSGYFQITETGVADRLTIDTSGNLNIKTSNAGIVFNNSSALTNSTLNDYETGTWTPTDGSGAGLSLTVTGATYTKIGRMVYASAQVSYPATASGLQAKLSGLPFAVGTGPGTGFPNIPVTSSALQLQINVKSATNAEIDIYPTAAGVTNAQLSSLAFISFTLIYPASF
jgi:hypothetical protein